MTSIILPADNSVAPPVRHHDDTRADDTRSAWLAMRRGWSLRCPACGRGHMFRAFLKVADHCPACGEALYHHRADDAPPYFTMLIVGHIVIGGVLTLEMSAHPDMWVHWVIWGPVLLGLSLFLLPRIKGALIGLQWALRMHGFGPGPDPAEVDMSMRKAHELDGEKPEGSA